MVAAKRVVLCRAVAVAAVAVRAAVSSASDAALEVGGDGRSASAANKFVYSKPMCPQAQE